MPDWFKTTPYGTCRWCNKCIYKPKTRQINKRRRWHPECQNEFWTVTDHRYAKREVKKRDKGICSDCGKYCHYRWEWQCDHIKPLVEANGDINFWKIENLSTKCVACHKKKTKQEYAKRKKRKVDKRKNNK